jgi:HK97 family phage prohead protease
MSDAPRDNLTRSAPFQLERADENGDGLTLSGHAAVFNEWTTIDSWEGRFREQIAPGAFRRTIRNNAKQVKLQFDHGQHPLIGSLPIGNITELIEDNRGLFVEGRLHGNWLIEPVREAITDKSIDGMSFRFSVVNETWDKVDSDLPERTITEVRLFELGPVVFPAYATTDVGVRSRELVRSLLSADDTTRREIAALLLRETGADTAEAVDPPDTPTTGPADNGTPDDGLVPSSDPAISHSRTYRPAQPPDVTPERRKEILARVGDVVGALA